MDLFTWFCGCILAFLLPPAVKTEEGGKFDTSAARLKQCVTRGVEWKFCERELPRAVNN